MFCRKCGAENADGAMFCKNCGEKLEGGTTGYQQGNGNTTPPMYDYGNQRPNIPPEYEPISMWGYFGYSLLFAIPCVGLIMILIFSFGGTKNINVRNFARAQFCVWIVALVFILISSMATGCTLSTLYGYM